MAILGAHMSIAGGYHRAVQRAAQAGCDCVQLFTHNNTRWQTKQITAAEAQLFRDAISSTSISHAIAHASYLINLASPDRRLWCRSVDALESELRRAAILGLSYVVIHPGSFTTSDEAAGLRQVARAIDEVCTRVGTLAVGMLLETTAGQGTSLGWRFEHLARILEMTSQPQRLGFCFDTCHVFAAGYPLRTARQYHATMNDFQRLVGVERIRAFHLNDSHEPRGSRIDRHQHIGQGKLGLGAFRNLLADDRFANVPMYLETPKGYRQGTDWDVINLGRLRRMARQVQRPTEVACWPAQFAGRRDGQR